MAKSKEKKETPAPKKPAAKKPAAHKAPPKTPGAAPLIDTSLVAENAAKLLAAGINLKNKPQQTSSKGESSLFKQLKSGLNKPHATTMDNLLDKTHGPSGGGSTAKGSQGFAKQVGHNQTVGSDAARTGVPRRNAG